MKQVTRDTTSAIVDGILRFLAGGGFITTSLVAPNAAQIFDKPLGKFLSELDERSRERELRRVMYYMKREGLIKYKTDEYEHGIQLTKQGSKRLKNSTFANLSISAPSKWDGRWRLVFFDIPVQDNSRRHSLTSKLRRLGFQQLQRSIWIHPFPCRAEIEMVGEVLGVRKYLTYVEITEIDAEKQLKIRFTKSFKSTLIN